MDLVWPLLLFRWLHIGALIVLFGSSLFALYEQSPEPKGAHPPPSASILNLAFAILALTSGLVWLALAHADLTESLESVWSASAWRVFLLQTSVGVVWIVRLCLLAALVLVALLTSATTTHTTSVAGVSAVLLVTLAWLGHAAAGHGGYVLGITAYACHVLAAAAWLGGLLPLFMRIRWAARHPEGMAAVALTLARFSRMGIIAVATIVGSGLVNASLRSVTVLDFVSTAYGRVLLFKLTLFALALALAATNRWRHLAQLDGEESGTSTLRALSLSVVIEQLLGVLIVGTAVLLGSMPPTE